MRLQQPLSLCWAASLAALAGLLYTTASAASAVVASRRGLEAEACVQDACVLVQHLAQQQRQEPALAQAPDVSNIETALSESEEEVLDFKEGEQLVEPTEEEFLPGHEETEDGAEDDSPGGEAAEEEDEEEEEEDEDEGGEEADDSNEEDSDDDAKDEEDDEEAPNGSNADSKAGAEDGEDSEDGEGEQGEADDEESEDDEDAGEKEERQPQEQDRALNQTEAGTSRLPVPEAGLAGEAAAANHQGPTPAAVLPGGLGGSTVDANGVLLFFAVGASNITMDLVTRNIDHARKTLRGMRADVFLAHYDKDQAAWLQRDEAWYRANVKYTSTMHGYKFKLAQEKLPKLLEKEEPYEWIWLLDEDADFTGTDLWRMLKDAEVTQSLIVSPSVIDMRPLPNGTVPGVGDAAEQKPVASLLQTESSCKPGSLMCQHQAPHKVCHFRYVTFLEVMFPLVRQEPLLKLLGDECEHCLHERSVWGLDKIWCGFTARMFNRSSRRTCAILDRVSVLHTDHRTMEKWGGHGKLKSSVMKVYTEEQADTLRHHMQDNGFSSTSTCVLPPKKVKFHHQKKHLRCVHPRKHEPGRRRRRRRGCTTHKNSRRRRRYKMKQNKAKLKAKERKQKELEKELRKIRGHKVDFETWKDKI